MKTNLSQISFNSQQQQKNILVPDDYPAAQQQQQHMIDLNDPLQKERFFESLGLPPDLSEQAVRRYSHFQLHQQQEGEEQMFKSCSNNPSAGG